MDFHMHTRGKRESNEILNYDRIAVPLEPSDHDQRRRELLTVGQLEPAPDTTASGIRPGKRENPIY